LLNCLDGFNKMTKECKLCDEIIRHPVNLIEYDEQPFAPDPTFKSEALSFIEECIQSTQMMDVANVSHLIAEYGLNEQIIDEKSSTLLETFDYTTGFIWFYCRNANRLECFTNWSYSVNDNNYKIQVVLTQQGYMDKLKVWRSNGQLLRECHFIPETIYTESLLFVSAMTWQDPFIKEMSEWIDKCITDQIGHVNGYQVRKYYKYESNQSFTSFFENSNYVHDVVCNLNETIPRIYYCINENTYYHYTQKYLWKKWYEFKKLFC